MKILIIGGNGQLGKTLNNFIPKTIGTELVDVTLITRKDLNLCDVEACKKIVQQIKPEFLINVAAYTNVDLAEKNSNLAFSVNSFAPQAFAEEQMNSQKMLN